MRNPILSAILLALLISSGASLALSSGFISASANGDYPPLTGASAYLVLADHHIIAGGGGSEGYFEVSVSNNGGSCYGLWYYEVKKNGSIIYSGVKYDDDEPIYLGVSGVVGDRIDIYIVDAWISFGGQPGPYGYGTITFGV